MTAETRGAYAKNRDKAKHQILCHGKEVSIAFALNEDSDLCLYQCLGTWNWRQWCRSPVLRILSDFRLVLSPAAGIWWMVGRTTPHSTRSWSRRVSRGCTLPHRACALFKHMVSFSVLLNFETLRHHHYWGKVVKHVNMYIWVKG